MSLPESWTILASPAQGEISSSVFKNNPQVNAEAPVFKDA